MVPVTGLEPVRHRWRWILSPLRLPFHHTGICATYYSTNPTKMQEKFCRTGLPSGVFSAFGNDIQIGTEVTLIALALNVACAAIQWGQGMPLSSALM